MSWPETLKLLNGLWPEASWTPEESALYREMLEPMDQQDLTKAIKRVRSLYTSPKPALRWLLDEVGRVKDDRRFRGQFQDGKVQIMNEGFDEVQIIEMRSKLQALDDQQREQLASRVRNACGMVLDFDTPIAQWTPFRVAMAAAAIDPGVG